MCSVGWGRGGCEGAGERWFGERREGGRWEGCRRVDEREDEDERGGGEEERELR